jgi:hypothetical protein
MYTRADLLGKKLLGLQGKIPFQRNSKGSSDSQPKHETRKARGLREVGMVAARTLNELLEVGGSEGGDSDGVLCPERRIVVGVGFLLQIPQVRGEHERRSHLASGGRRREDRGFGLGNGKLKGMVGIGELFRNGGAGGVKFCERILPLRAHVSLVV